MPIDPFNQAIFCGALQNMVADLDYNVLRDCFISAKNHLYEEGGAEKFYQQFSSNYVLIDSDRLRCKELFRALAFLLSYPVQNFPPANSTTF